MCAVLQARDQIVAINQQSTSDMTQQEAAQLLTGSQGPVTLQLLQGELIHHVYKDQTQNIYTEYSHTGTFTR